VTAVSVNDHDHDGSFGAPEWEIRETPYCYSVWSLLHWLTIIQKLQSVSTLAITKLQSIAHVNLFITGNKRFYRISTIADDPRTVRNF
jgi:hypothetical protein